MLCTVSFFHLVRKKIYLTIIKTTTKFSLFYINFLYFEYLKYKIVLIEIKQYLQTKKKETFFITLEKDILKHKFT